MQDIRTVHLTEIYESLYKFGRNRRRDLLMVDTELDDFVQTVIFNIFNRKGLDIPDEGKEYPGLQYLVYSIANRHLMDLKKTKFGTKKRQYADGKTFQFISISTPIWAQEEETLCLGDILEADKDIALVFFEMVERCSDEQISPKFLMTWKELLLRSMDESAEDIASSIGISEARVVFFQKKLAEVLCA
jgi:hypothetical protein